MAKGFAILIFILSFLPLETESTITISKCDCSNKRTFTPKSAYEANLNSLLESLSAHANSTHRYFETSEPKLSDADAVYGSYLCIGHAAEDVCVECVKNASGTIKEKCPLAKESILWYDQCMLRYSDRNFSSATDKVPLLYGYNQQNVEEPAEFMKLLKKTMNQLITLAAQRPDEKYAYKEAFFKARGDPLYTFVQCSPGILAAHCKDCLRNATSNLVTIQTGKIGGRVLLPSCFARFEIYPLYALTGLKVKKRGNPSSRSVVALVGITSATSTVVLLCVVPYFILGRKRNNGEIVRENLIGPSQMSELHSLQFDVYAIEAATYHFSNHNKLGEGGFGPVYRGTLPCGKEIAAKRLSQSSEQGVQEFKNEVELVANLQHRNLVRHLGFAKEREEAILVYEYVPNGSLDQLLFDPQQSIQLDWSARHKIMVGVARGLLYLHEDSRLRIIHRDLKAGNILLDDNMNPKISDFGTARIFGAEQTQGRTNRIVGTFGYMPPEYVMYGQFSLKSDVFSFGVLMLEIITGKKNKYSYVSDHYAGLLDYVWEHWRTGTLAQIVDPTLSESYLANEVIRCIHIGLLRVQNSNEARPAIDTVVLMLSSTDSVSLPMPEQPAFFFPSARHKQPSQGGNSDRSSEMPNSSKTMSQSPGINGCLTDMAL